MSDSTQIERRTCLYCPTDFPVSGPGVGRGQWRRILCGSPECRLAHRYERERLTGDCPQADRTCANPDCADVFRSKTNAKFCSQDCRHEVHRERHRLWARENYVAGTKRKSYDEIVCHRDGCDEVFKPYTKRSRYCSRLCSQRATDAEKLRRRQSAPRLCHKCNVVDVGWGKPGKPVCDDCKAPPRPNAQEKERQRRFRTYGITEAEYNAMLEGQGHRCGICRTDDPGAKGWAIDHCHESDMVRGILCGRCNSAIGLLRENPKIIAAAAQYVKRHLQIRLIAS